MSAFRFDLDLRAIFRLERSGLRADLRIAPNKYWFKIRGMLSRFKLVVPGMHAEADTVAPPPDSVNFHCCYPTGLFYKSPSPGEVKHRDMEMKTCAVFALVLPVAEICWCLLG